MERQGPSPLSHLCAFSRLLFRFIMTLIYAPYMNNTADLVSLYIFRKHKITTTAPSPDVMLNSCQSEMQARSTPKRLLSWELPPKTRLVNLAYSGSK